MQLEQKGVEDVIRRFSRHELLSRGAKGGSVLLLAGSAFGASAGIARATTTAFPDNDLAYLRLLITAELLGGDFYANAIQAQPYGAAGSKSLTRARFNEGEHYASLASSITASNQVPATADDIDFVYPKDTYASAGSITKLAVELETLFLGAYLGAVAAVQDRSLAQPLARIAANQAQHLTVFSQLLGRDGFGLSFPAVLSIGEASDALDRYTA
ncbi:MAG TPA: ferritin-like domain-containing protein [Gaiellaceae bacterium]